MRPSPTGTIAALRPTLGRVKRGLIRRRNAWSPSGAPAVEVERPPRATRATAGFHAGLMAQQVRADDLALRWYGRSLADDPRFAQRWMRYGDLLLRADRADEAVDAFRAAHDADPASFEPLLRIVARQLGTVEPLDDPTGVADEVERLAHEQGRDDRHLDFLLALVRQHAGDAAAARASFDRSIGDREVARPEWLLAFARFEAGEGRSAEAVALYREAIGARDDEASIDVLDALDGSAAPDDVDGWAAVAAAAGLLLDDDPANLEARRSLGFAQFGLQEWDAAVDTLRRVSAELPQDIDVLNRLARAATNAEQHDLAVQVRHQSVALSPTGRRFRSLAVTLERAGRFDEAISAYEQAILLGEPGPGHDETFGAAQRASGSWAGAAALYRWAVERDPDVGFLWYHLGYALEQVDDLDAALAAYRRAVDLEPHNARWHFRLGHLHERHGPLRTTALAWTGLEQQPAGDPELATQHYRQAIELDPTLPGPIRRLAEVHHLGGHFDLARRTLEQAIELDPTDARLWHLLGRTIAARANARGMYHVDEHDELERVWGQAIRLAPRRSDSRVQLTRASIKAARWPLADELAWFPPPATSDGTIERTLRRALAGTAGDRDELQRILQLPPSDLTWVPREWWFPLHWRLASDNEFTLAGHAKRLMAERIVRDGPSDPAVGLGAHLEYARALAYLGRLDEALAALSPSLTDPLPRRVRRVMERHRADVSLLMGNTRPHLEFRHDDLDPHVRVAEERFQDLIRGRSVAIVGPGQSNLAHGPEIDAHDVVIRTKFVQNQFDEASLMAGDRTDISYYALGSARFLQSDIADALRSGALEMAVFRTATYTPTPPHLVTPGDLRYVPSEYNVNLRASQFAIQRIVYDVVRYSPAAIKVFNIDFFLSPEAYRPGYLADYAVKAVEQGYLKVLGAFGHDFLADFCFTKAMYDSHLLDVDANIREILGLSPDEYLAALDRRR